MCAQALALLFIPLCADVGALRINALTSGLSCQERKDEFNKAYKSLEIPEEEDPCRNGKENCVVSMTVYCRDNHCEDFYTRGIEKNIEFLLKVYPGWKLRIYTDGSLPQTMRDKILTNVSEEIVVTGVQGDIAGMFWRLFATHDPMVDRVIVRDSDNIVNLREKVLVNEWIRSGKKYHSIRDHPQHGVRLLGGAWGVAKKAGEVAAISKSVIEDRARAGELEYYMSRKGGDQDFLSRYVYPSAVDDIISHDSYLCMMAYSHGTRPIPVPRRGPRDVVCYPNNYEDEDELYLCDHPVEEVYKMMFEELGLRSPVQCRPEDHKDWEYN